MERCPKCKAGAVRLSRTKSSWEKWRKALTGKRPFRCRLCAWRGWGLDHGPQFGEAERLAAERAVAPDPPNLAGTVLAAEPKRTLEVNLKALDVLDPLVEPPRKQPRPQARRQPAAN